MIGIADLDVGHFYYCSLSNYTNNDAAMQFDTWQDFNDEFGDGSIDYNLCFRWDVKEETNDDDVHIGYKMEIFIMQQRRGNFVPCRIDRVTDADVESIIAYLTPHLEYLKNIWKPL